MNRKPRETRRGRRSKALLADAQTHATLKCDPVATVKAIGRERFDRLMEFLRTTAALAAPPAERVG